MVGKKNDVTLKMAVAFPVGTKVTTDTHKHGQKDPTSTVWTFNGIKFVNKKGEERTAEQLFPKGTTLDATGDGLFDKKDISIFNKMKRKDLSEKLAENIHGKYYMRVDREGGNSENDASVQNGKLSFPVFNYETRSTNTELGDRTNMTEQIKYTIDLPG